MSAENSSSTPQFPCGYEHKPKPQGHNWRPFIPFAIGVAITYIVLLFLLTRGLQPPRPPGTVPAGQPAAK